MLNANKVGNYWVVGAQGRREESGSESITQITREAVKRKGSNKAERWGVKGGDVEGVWSWNTYVLEIKFGHIIFPKYRKYKSWFEHPAY